MIRSSLSIVVPVYGDWESLKECIQSLKKSIPILSNDEVLLVNDCGPEADVIEANILRAIRYRHNFKYFRNSNNMGFVRNCNNAVLNLSREDNDVVLLNSDAIVTKGALQKMKQVLYSRDNIGAVCPRSNAATIFSIPVNNHTHNMQESYRLFRKIKNSLPMYYLSPIAHGFCMMIRREVVDRYGLFDEIYGKGYGEENDFCMRIRSQGWGCAVSNWSYVFHYKARSFTEERRSRQVEVNEGILDSRYPNYRADIEMYVNSDQVQKEISLY